MDSTFDACIEGPNVKLYGMEPMGIGTKTGQHAATITIGTP